MTKTTDFAPPIVSAFLREATKEQVNWYLAQSEPQCLSGTFMEEGELVDKIFPGLRGVMVGKEVKTFDEAIAKAGEVKAKLLEGDLEPFDEVTMGIDDEARDLQRAFDEGLVRLEAIAHVGTMQDGSISEPLEEMLERFDLEYPVAALDDLPFVRKALENEEYEAEIEDIIQIMRDHGAVGFLIEASVPHRTPHGDGSASIHYGTRRTNVFYASTFAAAARKAIVWAAKETAKMESKSA